MIFTKLQLQVPESPFIDFQGFAPVLKSRGDMPSLTAAPDGPEARPLLSASAVSTSDRLPCGPVPVSPRIKTVQLADATVFTRSATARNLRLDPINLDLGIAYSLNRFDSSA
jgi:hypothetical protein